MLEDRDLNEKVSWNILDSMNIQYSIFDIESLLAGDLACVTIKTILRIHCRIQDSLLCIDHVFVTIGIHIGPHNRWNIELLNAYNIKKILLTCPHGYHSFKNEYPQFGGDFEVVHHTQFIIDLIRNGQLKLKGLEDKQLICYHDSCYLGRYNDIYQQPRDILSSVNGVTTVEMARNLSSSFCCGAGGGHMWMEDDASQRLNIRRAEQLIETKADCVATACPFCLSMFEDGIKSKGAEESVRAMDLAELVAQLL